MKKRLTALVGMMLVGTMALTGCGAGSSQKVAITGSTTVAPIVEKAAEAYKAIDENTTIEVQGVGSSAGVKAAIDATADIGMSSRELKDSEKAEGLNEIVIAKDGIAIAVHPSNGVEDLTTEQLKGIFERTITNWSEVGGSDKDIIVVAREDGSGTRDAFQEILELEIATDVLIAEGNGAVKANIASKEDAIGFVSVGYLDDTVKPVKVDGAEATVENIKNETYSVQRPLLLLTQPEADELTQNVLDFMLSDEGQDIVEEEGYISVN